MDHLNGKLIVDHVSSIAKLQYKTHLNEIKENAEIHYSEFVSKGGGPLL
jgi:hypothetical protein